MSKMKWKHSIMDIFNIMSHEFPEKSDKLTKKELNHMIERWEELASEKK